MGDKSRMVIYSSLLNFLDMHGVDLSEFGSAERGLLKQGAVSFIYMLTANGIRALGIEPWRKTGSVYQCDSLGVWACDTEIVDPDNVEAQRIIELLNLGKNDVVTVQF